MGRTGKYRPGEYLVQCEICGRNRYSSDTQRNWKTQVVCSDTCYEQRHPHDRVKVRPDVARPENPRPDTNLTHSTTETGDVESDDLKTGYDDSDVDFITGYR